MSIHEVEEPPSGGMALVSIHDPTELRVDQVIEYLFPWPTQGQTFLARFKERASSERSSLPDEPANALIICTKSIATLGGALHLSYDTTQKYVALFRALGLLRKRSFMGQIAFILSLGIYLPPKNLEANLDYLLQRSQTKKSRSKFHGLVADVKERCLVYGLIDQEWTSALRQLHALLQPPEKGLSRRTLEQRLAQAQHLVSTMIARAMTERLPREDALLTQNLLRSPGMTGDDARRREGESTQQETTKRSKSVVPPNLPGVATSRDVVLQKQESESIRTGSTGRFVESSAAQNLPSMAAQVDSSLRDHDSESTQHGRSGRRVDGRVGPNLLNQPTQVDSSLRNHDSESTQPANPGRRSASADGENLPTGEALVDSWGLANVNVGNTVKTNINVNVEIVAAFLCRLFNEPASKKGIYSRLFRDGCNQAEAIHAAAIFALVHFHQDGTITNPAAMFIARCKDYHAQGVSEEAAALVNQYGSLSYQQLLDALHKPTAPSTPSKQGTSFLASPSRPATPVSLPPLPQWGTIPRLIGVSPSRAGMSRQEAIRVVARAQGDRRTKLCRVDLEQLFDGSYAVLLDNTITTVPRQTYFYSLHEWEARTASIKDCFELFGVAAARRRCLADALKERKTR
jgi:hypothetical protein